MTTTTTTKRDNGDDLRDAHNDEGDPLAGDQPPQTWMNDDENQNEDDYDPLSSSSSPPPVLCQNVTDSTTKDDLSMDYAMSPEQLDLAVPTLDRRRGVRTKQRKNGNDGDGENLNRNNDVSSNGPDIDGTGYNHFSNRNVDEHGNVETVNNDNSPYCKIPPPGADAIVAWFMDGNFHDQVYNEGGNGDDDDQNNEDDVPALEEQRLRQDPVRRFMGPLDSSLAREFRLRRRKKIEYDQGYHNKKAIDFDSVSYKQLDTPVWHNYTMELQRQSKKNDSKTKADKMKEKRVQIKKSPVASFSGVSQPDMGPTRTQLRRRPLIGCLRQIFSLPRSRNKSGPDSPVTAYQQDVQLLIRIVLICIGIIISRLSKCVEVAMDKLLSWKLNYVTSFQTGNTDMESPQHLAEGFGVFVGINLAFTTLAFLPILYRPVAAGSGIAEAKAVLNGIILPNCTDLLTALCKAVSVIFTASASMPVGLEGPLIFMGMALGENAQRFLPKAYAGLKRDRLKRDFAVVGTACGVTGAFLSPIGGVLFAMEEGASFWNTRLAWRSFAAACVTALTMYMWGLFSDRDFHFDVNSMAIYSGLDGENIGIYPAVSLWDYIVFAIMGAVGGILGAVWIQANEFISIRRNKVPLHLQRTYKFCELMFLSLLVSVLLWYLPQVYTVCSDISQTTAADKSIFRQMNCPPGQYNHLGTLFLNPLGSIGLNMLYWEPADVFHPVACVIAGSVYFVLLLFLFGTSVSMGIFIPLLYVGACFGRATAVLVGLETQFTRSYAIVASVAMLAGVVRVLISISAIVVCATSLSYMVTPFMVTTIFARVMGKAVFGKEGIYDVILDLKGIPFLTATAPKAIRLRGLRAQDVMSRSPLVTLEPEPSVGRIMEVLEKYPFPDYPIVDPTRGGIMIGVVTREDLLTIMTHPGLCTTSRDDDAPDDSSASKERQAHHGRLALRFEEFVWQPHQPGRPTFESVQKIVTDADRHFCVVDLTPYIEIGHYTLNRLVSIERTFEVFRTMGLRCLIITDPMGRPVGVVTRYDLKLLEEVGMDKLKLARMGGNVGVYPVS